MPGDFYTSDEKEKAASKPATAIALDAGPHPNLLPKIVASGRGLLAEQILRIAFDHGIKVRQDADLAELLATLDLDHEIPAEAVVAVAEILARVFEANARIVASPEGGLA